MPTTEQLHQIWETEFNCPEIRRNDDPMYVPPKKVTEFTGKHIGHFEYDNESDDIKIVVDPDTDTKAIDQTTLTPITGGTDNK